MWFKDYKKSLLISALLACMAFFLLEVTARIRGWYLSFPLIDLPVHFLSGVAVFLFFVWIFDQFNIRRKVMLSFILSLAAALIWEIAEIIEEYFVPNPPHLRDYFFWDGFFDTIAGMAGAVFALLLLYFLARKTKIFIGLRF